MPLALSNLTVRQHSLLKDAADAYHRTTGAFPRGSAVKQEIDAEATTTLQAFADAAGVDVKDAKSLVYKYLEKEDIERRFAVFTERLTKQTSNNFEALESNAVTSYHTLQRDFRAMPLDERGGPLKSVR